MSDEGILADPDFGQEEEAPKPKKENSTIRQMREALEAKEAEAKAAQERADRYEATFLASSGLNEKQSAALKAAGYDATPEGIDSFRAEVLGEAKAEVPEQAEAEEEETEDITPEQAGFAPTPTGQSAPRSRTVSSKDFLELLQTDPGKADKLLREGRVEHAQFNPGGPAF